MKRPVKPKRLVRCKTCGYTTECFNGWAFCGPCRTPEQPGMYHDFDLVEASASEGK